MDQTFTINENLGNNLPVGTVVATDQDTNPTQFLRYAFNPQNPAETAANNAFQINPANGDITVKDTSLLNFEMTEQFTITTEITDYNVDPSTILVSPAVYGPPPVSDGLTRTIIVTIDLDNINEAPDIPANQMFSVSEDALMDDPLGPGMGKVVANAVEPGEMYTFMIDSMKPFNIDPMTGALTVKTAGAAIDYEMLAPGPFTIPATVTVTDNGMMPNAGATTTIMVTVTDVNEAPDLASGQMFTIPENLGFGMPPNTVTVGTLNFSDPDLMAVESHVFNVTGTALTVDGNGVIKVADPSQLDFDMTPSFMVTVTVTDRAGTGMSDMETVTINLMNQNDPPAITLPAPATVMEDDMVTISGIAVSDDDAGMAPLLVDISVAHGAISLTSTMNLGLNDNDGSDGTLQFTGSQTDITAALMNGVDYSPTLNYHGDDKLTIVVNDQNMTPGLGGPKMTLAELAITVTPVNDEPTFTAVDPPASMEDDLTLQTVMGWATFDPGNANESGQSAVEYFVAGVNNTALFNQLPEVAANGDLTYSLAPDADGASIFTVSVRDDGGLDDGGDDLSRIQTFTITVSDVNDKPTFTAPNPPVVIEIPACTPSTAG